LSSTYWTLLIVLFINKLIPSYGDHTILQSGSLIWLHRFLLLLLQLLGLPTTVLTLLSTHRLNKPINKMNFFMIYILFIKDIYFLKWKTGPTNLWQNMNKKPPEWSEVWKYIIVSNDFFVF
jgi:hypothetical protein